MQLPDLSSKFPAYNEFSPTVPVYCVTPGEGRIIHRFYDTSPFSPSGRYMALTRLPFEDRLPRPGDAAQVVLVDLAEGTERVLCETRGWDTQLGAQVQWGADESQLFFNDLDTKSWRPFGVRFNPLTGARQDLEGTIYNVSPDGRLSASPCLRRTARTQLGYGVLVPPSHIPANSSAAKDDGIYVTDLYTGESQLLMSLERLVHESGAFTDPIYTQGDFYGFHAKWNPQGTRLMFILRWAPDRRNLFNRFKPASKTEMKKNVITMESDGSFPRVAIGDELWSKGGHHPNWCPDGNHVLMNLQQGEGLRFVRARFDGTAIETLAPGVEGSGHPTLHPIGRYILTDTYPGDGLAAGDGTVPIRWIDVKSGTEQQILRIRTVPAFRGPRKEMRVDAHPAWDSSFTRIAFNGCPDGTRRVYVADLSQLPVAI